MYRIEKLWIILCIVIIIGIGLFAGQYLDWVWFKSMAASKVFWVTMITGPLTKLIFGLIIFLFLGFNLMVALKSFNRIRPDSEFWPTVSKENLVLPGLTACVVLAAFLSSGLSVDWATIQQYLHQVRTGVTDPVYGKDIGFYLFSYPLYRQVNQLLQVVTFLGLAGSALIYFFAKAYSRLGRTWEIHPPAKIHLTILTIIFLLSKIWGYHLNRFGLLFQDTERLTGINYTAAHANLPSLNILTWLVVALIVVLILSLFRKSSILLIGSVTIWLAASIVLGGIYPALIQSLIVSPNEYKLEQTYLKDHIRLTRQAYHLDQIKIQPFQPKDTGTAMPDSSHPSLSDLRLWDYVPLKSSYNQLQSIRSYYDFYDIDIDRYPSINGQSQMMISARELNLYELDRPQSWINRHLVYTHGYGYAANRVNQFSDEGQPIFVTRDLPPKTTPEYPVLKVNRPEIYFGELTNDYIVVNTKNAEFDYPRGGQNNSTFYQGQNGIVLNSPLTKLLFALKFREINFLLSGDLTSHSQVLLYRNIRTRVQKLAPFLKFDGDPYLVVAQHRLYWIIDGYTISSFYPYARRHNSGINYIRNSVKAVIDAYHGNVNFYITDEQDPIIQVWQKIFPNLFKPVSMADAQIASHFRYPEDLMSIQRDMLAQYHMTDTKTFYLQEDYWDVPVYNNKQTFDPYYVTLLLPGESKGEFVLMQPFSPRNKQNLISWLVARCDRPQYGELILYTLPKDINIYGPAQIDNRIGQNETISQLITLWNQNQSKVTWGNLLIIPIQDSILYVKPLFIESDEGQQAELKKIVMVYKNQVLLGDTIAEALTGMKDNSVKEPSPSEPEDALTKRSERRSELLKQIEEHTREIQRLLKELNNA